jgi:RNA polymerase sigma-70 factor (ECF subfamily)
MGSRVTDMTSIESEDNNQSRFKTLFESHYQSVFSIAFRVSKSKHKAADIVQEVFIKLWEHRSEIGQIQNMEAWLTTAVKRKLIDFMRKAAADSRLRNSLWNNIQHNQIDTPRILEDKEYETIIRKAIDDLPAQRKTIYRMNRENGLSYQEIADELSISKHTVKNQIFMAIRFLQKKFATE